MRAVTMLVGGCVAALGVITGCNEQGLQGTIPHIVVDPQEVDFGRVEQGIPGPDQFMITNTGSQPLEVYEFVLVPEAGPFGVADPNPAQEAPVVLGPNDEQIVQLSFVPLAPGGIASKLQIKNNDPNEPVVTVDLSGTGFFVQTDYFTQPSLVGEADILFIIDSSGSMYGEQVKLGTGFGTFINWIANTVVDYQIAVTTTDATGQFYGIPQVIVPTTPDVPGTFAANAQVGTFGSGYERGFDAAVAALAANPTFLRPDAFLYLMFVSDEDDFSSESVLYFVDYFADLKGGREKVFFSSISGPPDSTCSSDDGGLAYPGPRYHYISNLGQGNWGSICQTNFGHSLLQLGFAVSGLYGEFALTQQATEDTVQAWVDDVEQVYGVDFYFDTDNNAVVFVTASLPAAGANVRVRYEVDTLN